MTERGESEVVERVPYEREARAVWNRHRNKWTQPDWDRLPLQTRQTLIRMAEDFALLIAALERS